jgi:hypothetical protein
VNPRHLFLGTNAENTADKVRKKRHPKGARIHTAKLTDNDVLAILNSGDTCAELALRFGVSDVAISYIKLGKTWKHVPRPDGYAYVPAKSKVNNRWINRA